MEFTKMEYLKAVVNECFFASEINYTPNEERSKYMYRIDIERYINFYFMKNEYTLVKESGLYKVIFEGYDVGAFYIDFDNDRVYYRYLSEQGIISINEFIKLLHKTLPIDRPDKRYKIISSRHNYLANKFYHRKMQLTGLYI